MHSEKRRRYHSFNKNKNRDDVFLHVKSDRRSLPDVPSVGGKRVLTDRRGGRESSEESFTEQMEKRQLGIRYLNDYEVRVITQTDGKKESFTAHSFDVSMTGMGIYVTKDELELMEDADKIRLKFHVDPGSMPEGYEMNINTHARVARIQDAGCRIQQKGKR